MAAFAIVITDFSAVYKEFRKVVAGRWECPSLTDNLLVC